VADRPLEVVLVLGTSTGGIGQHVRSVAAGLVHRGLTVRVCGPAATEELFSFTAAGAQFRSVEIAAGLRPGADLAAVRALRRATAAADLVHAHGLRAGLVTDLALAGRRTPYVVSWHNALAAGGPAGWGYRRLERRVARGAAITLAASADLADRARRLGAGDVRVIEVAAPALAVPRRSVGEVRRELGATDRPLLLTVGRLHPQKGLDVLLAAATAWSSREPTPLTVIAGDGPLEPKLRVEIERSGAGVRLLGRRADIAELLAAADLVVLPSRWEARALVAQEALRAGRPLVATSVGGLPELLGDGAALVAPADPAALAAAVNRLLDHPEQAAALAERGRNRAATWPDEATTVRRLVAVYAELTGRPG
jgi:glycosyltransferase involved in cell wall biosynthesis